MSRSRRGLVLAIVAVALAALSGCSQPSAVGLHEAPASLEPIAGSDHHRIALTERAAERIGVEAVAAEAADPAIAAGMTSVPYSAVLYDPDGTTFVYVNPEPLVFVREDVQVDRIGGEVAILSAGPEVGTMVVAVGAAELLGTESEIGH